MLQFMLHYCSISAICSEEERYQYRLQLIIGFIIVCIQSNLCVDTTEGTSHVFSDETSSLMYLCKKDVSLVKD